MTTHERPRRSFIKQVIAAGAAVSASAALPAPVVGRPDQAPGIGRLDHAAIPMLRVDEMVAFYRRLGFAVREGAQIVSIHFADQKINLHRPGFWRSESFTLRAASAEPPCGDFCWVWEGTESALRETLARAGADIETEGPRTGGADGGDAVGQSIYTRDPDGNLLEFIRY